MLKQWRWQEIISGLVLLVAGIILLFMPGLTLLTIARAAGGIVIALGLIFGLAFLVRRNMSTEMNASIVSNLVLGILFLFVGLFVVIRAKEIISIVPTILGLGITISGIAKLIRSFELLRMKYSSWKKVGITALVNILLGLLIVLNPFSAVEWVIRIVGIALIYSGVSDLITTLYVSKKAHDFNEVIGTAVELDPETLDVKEKNSQSN